jgi:hypothetical protein
VGSKKRDGGKDLTTEILVQIRDEMRNVSGEQRSTNQRLDRLERRQSEDATRLATELSAVAQTIVQVRDLLREQRDDRGRLDNHEQRIKAVEKKIAAR